MSEAIDEVEKEVTYNPRTFLGIALYPDSIISFVSFLFTIAYTLYESSSDK